MAKMVRVRLGDFGAAEVAEIMDMLLRGANILSDMRQEDSQWLYNLPYKKPQIQYVSVVKEKPTNALQVFHRHTFTGYLVERLGRGGMAYSMVKMLYLVPK